MVNTVTTASGSSLLYGSWQKKIVRTSDGTIHALICRTGYTTHYYSYDNGITWSSYDVWSWSGNCAIDKDPNDNLIAASGGNGIHFKKATVSKVGQWTWSWGSDKWLVGPATANYPDIVSDSNSYYHIAWENSVGNGGWLRSIDGGANWTNTSFTFVGAFNCVTVIKDSSNNLYFFGAQYCKSTVWGKKYTFSPGPPPTWTAGPLYQCSVHSGEVNYPPSCAINDDNRLMITYIHDTGVLYFRKTTNPSDISAWNNGIQIYSGITLANYGSYHSCAQGVNLRVYYINSSNLLAFKESTDNGISFGNEVLAYQNGTNSSPSSAKWKYNRGIDFLWRNSEANSIYQARFGEAIENGGFETGDFTGWDGVTEVEIEGEEVHSGTYSAWLTTAGVSSIYQALDSDIPVSEINSFTNWVRIQKDLGDLPLRIGINYSDDTYEEFDYYPNNYNTWEEVDILPHLNQAKTFHAVWFIFPDIGSGARAIWIDDVSLPLYGEGPIELDLFESLTLSSFTLLSSVKFLNEILVSDSQLVSQFYLGYGVREILYLLGKNRLKIRIRRKE